MIKLIASDIDGTLVTDGTNKVNPEIFEVVLKLKERIFYLSDNGAYVGCHGRNLFLNTIDRELALEMVEDIKKEPELEVMLSGPDVVYMDTKDQEFVDWIIDGYKFQVKLVEDVREVDDRFIKVSAYKKHGVQEATKEIRKKYENRMKVTISGDMWMDCMALGVCKGQAIEVLQKGLDIKPEETMAFGDQLNDVEMLGRAYYSFAVGNARPEVKAAARFQTDTNRNDGVLKILKMLL